jgi:hypothetical protein
MKKFFLLSLLFITLLSLSACGNSGAASDGDGSAVLDEPSSADATPTATPPADAAPAFSDDDFSVYWGRPATERFVLEITEEPTSAMEEEIFKDEYFTYNLPNKSSHLYTILFADGTRQPLMDALETKRVSLEDCIANGLPVTVYLNQQGDEVLGNSWLCMGNKYQFTLDDEPFYPTIYFMIDSYTSSLYPSALYSYDEVYETILSMGHTEAAEKLKEYNTGRDIPDITGNRYYDADMLYKAAGIKVYRELDALYGFTPPMPVRFVTEGYVGDEVLIRNVDIHSHDYGSGWLIPYEHILASETNGVAADMLELSRATFDSDMWEDYVFMFVDGYDAATVSLGGLAMSSRYAVYERGSANETPLNEGTFASGKSLTLPKGLGQYTVCLTVSWGVAERSITCQYWFGVDKVQ